MYISAFLLIGLYSSFCNGFWSYTEGGYYEIRWLEVPLDHFSYKNQNQTFKMRYFYNDTFWEYDKGPIFFYTGGETELESTARHTSFIWEIAPHFKALVVYAEHRYYGQSLPFGDDSTNSIEKLAYLTSMQAIADYVQLLDLLQQNSSTPLIRDKYPVVLFGEGYSGALAAWLKMKYPFAANGAIASSAPIFPSKIDCKNFREIVWRTYAEATSEFDCSKFVQKSLADVWDMASDQAGKKWLTGAFNTCEPLHDESAVRKFVEWLEKVYGLLVEYNFPYPSHEIVFLERNPVKTFCDKLQLLDGLSSKVLLQAVRDALGSVVNHVYTSECWNITRYFETSVAWEFQNCAEFKYPTCTSELYQAPPNDSQSHSKNFCEEKYNHNFKQRYHYPRNNLHPYSNILFVNGELDPWISTSLRHDVSDSVQALVIPSASRSLVLKRQTPLDSDSLGLARVFVAEKVEEWVNGKGGGMVLFGSLLSVLLNVGFVTFVI